MEIIESKPGIWKRAKLPLGKEKRTYYLNVFIPDDKSEKEFYLFDYFGWPIVESSLADEAKQAFLKDFEKNVDN